VKYALQPETLSPLGQSLLLRLNICQRGQEVLDKGRPPNLLTYEFRSIVTPRMKAKMRKARIQQKRHERGTGELQEMKPEVKALWLSALLSGAYRQAERTCGLRRTDKRQVEQYCCLGVLCDLAPIGEWSETMIGRFQQQIINAIPDPIRFTGGLGLTRMQVGILGAHERRTAARLRISLSGLTPTSRREQR
jgi:hypothetical protein